MRPHALVSLGLLLVAPATALGADPSLADGAAIYLRLTPTLLEQPSHRGLLALLDHPGLGQALTALKLPQLGAGLLKDLGVDGSRDLVASLGIADAASVSRVLGAKQTPTSKTPLPVARFQILVPYSDVPSIERSLDRLFRHRRWTPAQGNPRRLADFLAALPSDAARAAARKIKADYLVSRDGVDAALFLQRATRTLEVRIAFSGLAMAAAPLAEASAEQRARLERAGFFKGKLAIYCEAAPLALLGQALNVRKVVEALAGVDAQHVPALWQAAKGEINAGAKLAAFSPRLIDGFLLGEELSFELTAEGVRALRGLVPARLDLRATKRLASALAKRLPLSAGEQPTDLLRQMQEAGFSGYAIGAMFLWPYGLARAATASSSLDQVWPKLGGVKIAPRLDVKRRRLALRISLPKPRP
jgi:hypothetical protein